MLTGRDFDKVEVHVRSRERKLKESEEMCNRGAKKAAHISCLSSSLKFLRKRGDRVTVSLRNKFLSDA